MPVALAVRACHPEPRAFVFRLWLWHPLRKAAMEVFNEGAPMPGAHLVPRDSGKQVELHVAWVSDGFGDGEAFMVA